MNGIEHTTFFTSGFSINQIAGVNNAGFVVFGFDNTGYLHYENGTLYHTFPISEHPRQGHLMKTHFQSIF